MPDDDASSFIPLIFSLRTTGLTPEERTAVLGRAVARSALYRKYKDILEAMSHEIGALAEEEYAEIVKAKQQGDPGCSDG